MLDLGVGMEHDFNRRFFGRSMDVLWEAGEPHGPGLLWSGLTPNYIRVTAETQAGADLTNQITPTRILAATTGGVTGEIIEGPFGRSSGVTPLNLPARS